MNKKLKLFLWRTLGIVQGSHSERHTKCKYFTIGNIEIRLKRKVR